MGARGPAPTPTKILESRGSWRAKLNPNEPKPATAKPTCPAWLTGEARKEWARQVSYLAAVGLIAKMDRAALACFCEAWGEFVEACQWIAKNGRTFVGPSGPRLHPMLHVKNAAADRVLRLAAQFGFTPAARARLSAPEVQNAGDPMEKLLANMN